MHPRAAPDVAVSLPEAIKAQVWRGSELAGAVSGVISTGWRALDDVLPGGGWPLRGVTEVLAAQAATLEWRLLEPALRTMAASKREVVAVGPPRHPCMAGLRHLGVDDSRFIWVRAEQPAERLWATEQLIRSASTCTILAWLPQVRAEQIRRLQVCAQGSDALVILFRGEQARREASAAPLRMSVAVDMDWGIRVDVFKRAGSPVERSITLPSTPGGLQSILTTRLRCPSTLDRGQRWNIHALGLPASISQTRPAANIA